MYWRIIARLQYWTWLLRNLVQWGIAVGRARRITWTTMDRCLIKSPGPSQPSDIANGEQGHHLSAVFLGLNLAGNGIIHHTGLFIMCWIFELLTWLCIIAPLHCCPIISSTGRLAFFWNMSPLHCYLCCAKARTWTPSLPCLALSLQPSVKDGWCHWLQRGSNTDAVFSFWH